ncbi:MAG: hypothetical protein CTY19_01860 [Methylomonas sp.]|nr:MAG: hypothetical protein CTY19_01860 [Methylomonas sp.]
MKPPVLSYGSSICLAIILAGCANQHPTQQPAQYVPGLGEIMAQSAVRHAKLWFAGQSQNWALAAYEIDELHEGFEDAAQYHPTHKHIKQPIPELIGNFMNKPLAALEQSVKDQNLHAFNKNFDSLTAACNACHQSTEFGFNQVTTPLFNPFANQKFDLNH